MYPVIKKISGSKIIQYLQVLYLYLTPARQKLTKKCNGEKTWKHRTCSHGEL